MEFASHIRLVPGHQRQFSFTQYGQVLNDPQFHSDLSRTLIVGVSASLFTVAVSIPFTLVLARLRRRIWRLVLLIALFTPFLTGDITRTFGWIVALGPHGPIYKVANLLGLGNPVLLGTDWAIGIGITQVSIPIVVVVLLPAALKLDPELEAAARTLGARGFRVFLSVILPQLRATAFTALAIAFALSMSSYADPLILGQGRNDFLSNLCRTGTST